MKPQKRPPTQSQTAPFNTGMPKRTFDQAATNAALVHRHPWRSSTARGLLFDQAAAEAALVHLHPVAKL